jgi:hypothetical protein
MRFAKRVEQPPARQSTFISDRDDWPNRNLGDAEDGRGIDTIAKSRGDAADIEQMLCLDRDITVQPAFSEN